MDHIWGYSPLSHVNVRQDLDPVTKFSHLLNCLEGEAVQLVKEFPLTAASYAEAVELLKAEYGKHDIIVRSHINALYKMQNRKVTSEPSSLKGFFVDINTHVRSLRSLGKGLNELGDMWKRCSLTRCRLICSSYGGAVPKLRERDSPT